MGIASSGMPRLANAFAIADEYTTDTRIRVTGRLPILSEA